MRRAIPAVILLVGPPGSGKTTVGIALRESHGYRYTDREADLLARYGSAAAFLVDRDLALRTLHDAALAEAAELDAPPLVYETTALTERPYIEEMRLRFATLAVRLTVPVETALARTSTRATGRNLQNSAEAVRRTWQACEAAHASMTFDLHIDMGRVGADEAAERIDRAVAKRSV